MRRSPLGEVVSPYVVTSFSLGLAPEAQGLQKGGRALEAFGPQNETGWLTGSER
jgi:hypothetical protein